LGFTLYLPEDWCEDPERRRKAKIPKEVAFQTKPELGFALIRRAATFQIKRAPVLGDAAYGDNTALRTALDGDGIEYVLSISPDTAVFEWPEGRDARSDYWISNLPAKVQPERLARLARLRWMIELDHRQLKGQLGLDHYEGRSYLGWHHDTALVTMAHAFLTLERQNPKAQRRASQSPKRSACSSRSSTVSPDAATPAANR
jgi:SRSO17 transposase